MLDLKKIFIRKLNTAKRDVRSLEELTLREVIESQKEGVILIDVRSPQEFREGHIDGAISIPEYEIKKEIGNVIKNKSQKMILYCSTGNRSKRALLTLKKMGYNNVYILKDSYELV